MPSFKSCSFKLLMIEAVSFETPIFAGTAETGFYLLLETKLFYFSIYYIKKRKKLGLILL